MEVANPTVDSTGRGPYKLLQSYKNTKTHVHYI